MKWDLEDLREAFFPKAKDHCRGRGVYVGVDHGGCLGFYGGSRCSCECHDNPALLVDSSLKMPEIPKEN